MPRIRHPSHVAMGEGVGDEGGNRGPRSPDQPISPLLSLRKWPRALWTEVSVLRGNQRLVSSQRVAGPPLLRGSRTSRGRLRRLWQLTAEFDHQLFGDDGCASD